MAKKHLTDKFVASVKAPKDVPQVDYFDAGHPALALRVGHRDKVWTLHRREHGVLKRLTLGRYPEMSLAEAREAWRLNRKAISQGKMLIVVDRRPRLHHRPALSLSLRNTYGHGGKARLPTLLRQSSPGEGGHTASMEGPGGRLESPSGTCSPCWTASAAVALPRARRVFATLRTFFDWCLNAKSSPLTQWPG